MYNIQAILHDIGENSEGQLQIVDGLTSSIYKLLLRNYTNSNASIPFPVQVQVSKWLNDRTALHETPSPHSFQPPFQTFTQSQYLPSLQTLRSRGKDMHLERTCGLGPIQGEVLSNQRGLGNRGFPVTSRSSTKHADTHGNLLRARYLYPGPGLHVHPPGTPLEFMGLFYATRKCWVSMQHKISSSPYLIARGLSRNIWLLYGNFA